MSSSNSSGSLHAGCRAFPLLTATLLLTACASIQSFTAAPRTLCASDVVTVTWAASGAVTLDAEPALPATGAKDSSGTEQFRPAQATRFSLRAARLFSSVTAEADVAVAPREREFGGVAMCPGSEGGVSLSVPLGGQQVGSSLTVTSVTNMNRRAMTITKDGITASVASGASSAAFDGQRAVGTWIMRAPLAADETCERALTSLGQRLTFKLGFRCGE